MKNITCNLNFTISKLCGVICILTGVALIIFKQYDNAVAVMGIGSGLIAVKTVVQKNEKV